MEKLRRRRTWPGKRKGFVGRKAHAEALKRLERRYDNLSEEDKERLRAFFDELPHRDT